MMYFDFNFDEMEKDSYVGCAYLHINPEIAENYKDVFVFEAGHIDKPIVDCFAVMEFFPDDYGMVYFRGSGKNTGSEAEGLEHELVVVAGYMRYISTHAAVLDGIEYYEKATGKYDNEEEAGFEYKIVSNREAYGEIGFLDERTILFQNDFMEMVMRTPKEVKNVFEYQILRIPEAV